MQARCRTTFAAAATPLAFAQSPAHTLRLPSPLAASPLLLQDLAAYWTFDDPKDTGISQEVRVAKDVSDRGNDLTLATLPTASRQTISKASRYRAMQGRAIACLVLFRLLAAERLSSLGVNPREEFAPTGPGSVMRMERLHWAAVRRGRSTCSMWRYEPACTHAHTHAQCESAGATLSQESCA